MSEENKKKLVPKYRFPEFKDAGEWEEKRLRDVCISYSGGTPNTSKHNFYNGAIPFIRSAEIGGNVTELSLTEEGLQNSSAKLVKEGDVLIALYGANSGDVAISKINGAINQAILCLKSEESNSFIYHFLYHRKKQIVSSYIQGGQGNLSGEIVKTLLLPFPTLPEQKRIADCLSSLDDTITAQTEKVESLELHKKGLMQKLFPKDGEKIPEYRFPEFKDAGEWEEKRLGECLDYKQPTPYLVSNENYCNKYQTPVLTAGKSFILGNTDEKEGIFKDNLPVIIFDDFTTDSKFVSFPFKVKSSAIKILTPRKDTNIKFMYSAIQIIEHEVGTHKRHWISVFSKINIPIPTLPEQNRIADCLSSLDDRVEAEKEKLDLLKLHKKALMQGLFPNL